MRALPDANKRLKDARLFKILSYRSNQLPGQGNTAASIDELYLFLTHMTAIEYIRKRRSAKLRIVRVGLKIFTFFFGIILL